MSELVIRPAASGDAAAMAAIFREGIEDRVATFETEPPTASEMAVIAGSDRPVLIAECDRQLLGWAKVAAYSDPHDYYVTIGEATLYVARRARRAGVGRALLVALAEAAERDGYHKLTGKVFTTNHASIELLRRCGWRDVGVHIRHGRLDDEWRDVLVVELLLGEAAA